MDPDNEKVIAEEGRVIDEKLALKISDALGRNAEVPSNRSHPTKSNICLPMSKTSILLCRRTHN